jgi:TetR/AcrR family transcriptional regulator, transcriptional repressor for nem operon
VGHSQADKTETHARIVGIAAKRFREVGLEGVSISDLMKEAGLTHGGFYKHFPTRDALVDEAVERSLVSGTETSLPPGGKLALEDLIRSYLNASHRDNPGEGCAVCALMNDMSHAGETARALYTKQVEKNLGLISQILASGSDKTRRANAILVLSALVGALGLSRAVQDANLSDEILNTVTESLVDELST